MSNDGPSKMVGSKAFYCVQEVSQDWECIQLWTLTRSRFRYFETMEYAFAIPIPGIDGRKSHPAKTHIPGKMP